MELLKQEGKRLDEKATLAAVKRQLYFLRDHFWLLQEEESGMVKEQLELLDFLPYTKSVIQVQAHPRSYQGDPETGGGFGLSKAETTGMHDTFALTCDGYRSFACK